MHRPKKHLGVTEVGNGRSSEIAVEEGIDNKRIDTWSLGYTFFLLEETLL